jgi:hypothetical protein
MWVLGTLDLEPLTELRNEPVPLPINLVKPDEIVVSEQLDELVAGLPSDVGSTRQLEASGLEETYVIGTQENGDIEPPGLNRQGEDGF